MRPVSGLIIAALLIVAVAPAVGDGAGTADPILKLEKVPEPSPAAGELLELLSETRVGTGEPDWDSAGITEDWIELEAGPDPSPAAQEAARELLEPLSEAQVGTLDALRFLVRPRWARTLYPELETDTRMLPFEEPGEGPLTVDELRRLWALAQAGYPVEEHLVAATARLVETPVVVTDGWLDQALALMLALRAVYNSGVGDRPLRGQVRQYLRRVWLEVLPWLERVSFRRFVRPRTSCVLSTVLFWRIAYEFRLRHTADFLDVDFEIMARQAQRVPRGREESINEFELLSAFTAASLAVSGEWRRGPVEDHVREMLPVITERLRYNVDHHNEYGFRASLLAMLNSLDDDFRPQGMNAAEWRAWIDENARYWAACNGALPMRSQRLNPRSWKVIQQGGTAGSAEESLFYTSIEANRSESRPNPSLVQQRIQGSSMVLVGLSGGLLPDVPNSRTPPVQAIQWDKDELERLMQARTIVAAAEHNRLTREARDWIPGAIRRGARQLAGAQRPDGGIMIPHNSYYGHSGPTALAGLALLHAGYSRDGAVIQGVLRFVEEQTADNLIGRRESESRTYELACVLLFLQQYYLPQQTRARAATDTEREARHMAWRSLPEKHRLWIDALAEGIESARVYEDSAWSYGRTDDEGNVRTARLREYTKEHELPPEEGYRGDNSNAQFAMLGLWAAGLIGRPLCPDMLLSEIERAERKFMADAEARPVSLRLPTAESESGSATRVAHAASTAPGGWRYREIGNFPPNASMTAAVLNILPIAVSELRVWGTVDEELEQRVLPLYAGGFGFLSERLRDHLGGAVVEYSRHARGQAHYHPLRSPWTLVPYELYSVERAGVLLHVRTLYGNRDWYRSGVLYMKRRLSDDEVWNCSSYDIAWLVLFLKRAVPHELPPPAEPSPPVTGPGE
jgi:hypothetical protein